MNEVPCWNPLSPKFDLEENSLIESDQRLVVVHFWAEWNQYDRYLDRTIQELKVSFESKIIFRSCDVDREKNPRICNPDQVVSVPALGLFSNQVLMDIRIGTPDKSELECLLSSWIEDNL